VERRKFLSLPGLGRSGRNQSLSRLLIKLRIQLKVSRRFGGICRLHLLGQRIRQPARSRYRVEPLFILRHCRWRRYVPPNCTLTFNGQHDVIAQMTVLATGLEHLVLMVHRGVQVNFNTLQITVFVNSSGT
jgi:hypothetical protein